MKNITFLYRTEIDGIRQVIPIEARTIAEANAKIAAALWPGERRLF